MKISATLLSKLVAVRDARNASAVLPNLVTADRLKAARAAVWGEIRTTYNLPTHLKFKVELDGPDAGELRRKDTSQPFVPTTPVSAAATGASGSAQARFVVIDMDDPGAPQTVDGQAALFSLLAADYNVRVVAV